MAQAFIGGTITPAGIFMVNHGKEKTFVMTPDAGFIVSDVVVNGVSMGNMDTYTFYDIRENSTIKAYFAVSQGIGTNDEAALTVVSNHNVVTII